jgi:hypothetical protein
LGVSALDGVVDDGAGASGDRDADGDGVESGFAASGARVGVGDDVGDGPRTSATVGAGVGAASSGVQATSVMASALRRTSVGWGR